MPFVLCTLFSVDNTCRNNSYTYNVIGSYRCQSSYHMQRVQEADKPVVQTSFCQVSVEEVRVQPYTRIKHLNLYVFLFDYI